MSPAIFLVESEGITLVLVLVLVLVLIFWLSYFAIRFRMAGCNANKPNSNAPNAQELITTNAIPIKLESYVGLFGSSVINSKPPNNVKIICTFVKNARLSSAESTYGPSFTKKSMLTKTINSAMTNCAEDPGAIMVIAPVSNIFFKMTVTSQYQYLGSYCKYSVPNSSTTSTCFR